MKTITAYLVIVLDVLTVGNARPATFEEASAAALARRCHTESYGDNGGTTQITGDCSGYTFSGTNVVDADASNGTASGMKMAVKRDFPYAVHPPECQSMFAAWPNSCSTSCLGRLPNVVSCSKDVFDMNCLCQSAEKQALDSDLEYCTWRACGHPSIEWMTKLCNGCDQARQQEQADRQQEIASEGGNAGYGHGGHIGIQ